jgi:hypothetical protein
MQFKLVAEILARSVARDWNSAKEEWELEDVYLTAEPETCLCGHFPIIEVCFLRNSLTGTPVLVGNCCVKKFQWMPTGLIFDAVKRVKKNPLKALNPEAIVFARKKGWVNEWEFGFYAAVMRKRKLTYKQLVKLHQLNERILKHIAVSSPPVGKV